MPDSHRRAMPQVTAVDELFGTHRLFVSEGFDGAEPGGAVGWVAAGDEPDREADRK
jgi:hypothetical protein